MDRTRSAEYRALAGTGGTFGTHRNCRADDARGGNQSFAFGPDRDRRWRGLWPCAGYRAGAGRGTGWRRDRLCSGAVSGERIRGAMGRLRARCGPARLAELFDLGCFRKPLDALRVVRPCQLCRRVVGAPALEVRAGNFGRDRACQFRAGPFGQCAEPARFRQRDLTRSGAWPFDRCAFDLCRLAISALARSSRCRQLTYPINKMSKRL